MCGRNGARLQTWGGGGLIADIPDRRLRLEFDQRAKTPEEERMMEYYRNNRAEFDRLLKEHVSMVLG